MKEYTLAVNYPEWRCLSKKQLKNDTDAIFWSQLCLDICGKDEHGRRYVAAVLFEGTRIVKTQWKHRE